MEQIKGNSSSKSQTKADVKVEQRTQKKERHQVKPSETRSCPNCHAEVDKNAEFCPYCGHKLVDYCTFCGAKMAPNETVCEECGMPASGVKCPQCGTLNVHSFCRHCNTPLTKAAMRAIERAKQDPKVQKAAALMDKAAELEEKMERLKAGKPSQIVQPVREITEAERSLMELFEMKSESVTTPQVAEETESLEAIQHEYQQVVKDINAVLDEMAPPNGSTPQEQFAYYSAQKVAVEATRKVVRKSVKRVCTGWVCNFCGCHHRVPGECVEPWLGGKWIYKDVTVYEETTETYTTYKYE